MKEQQKEDLKEQQELYSLRWHDFQTSILSSFRHLRDQEDFVDVTLACDGKSFTAHKMVLSACSPYFRHLLKVTDTHEDQKKLTSILKKTKTMATLLKFRHKNVVVSASNFAGIATYFE